MSKASTVVMVSPDQFGFNAETAATNTFQHRPSQTAVKTKEKALKEFREMVGILEGEKIRVLVLGSRVDVVSPDAVFPNNWFSHHEDGTLVVYPMMAENRRLERQPHNLKNLLQDAGINHIKIADFSRDELEGRVLEGTGSLVLDRQRKLAFAVESSRTNKAELEKWCRKMGYEAVLFHAVDRDKPVYHTNVFMSLGDRYAVVCLDAVTSERERYLLENKIKETGREVIQITITQMDSYCGNILQLQSQDKKPKIIMSKTAHDAFTPSQRAVLKKYGKLVTVEIPTIENVGGGSARCMVAEIFG